MLNYSAGFTKEGWFEKELLTVLELKREGFNRKEILEKVIDGNLFQLRSVPTIETRYQMVFRRSEAFDEKLVDIYIDGTIYDRKVLILYSYLKAYRLPYEFFVEEILPRFNTVIQRSDFDYFLEKKEVESEKVRSFRPETKKRLVQSMILFFRESGLFHEEEKDKFRICPLHMSQNLKGYAQEHAKLLLLLSNIK